MDVWMHKRTLVKGCSRGSAGNPGGVLASKAVLSALIEGGLIDAQ